MRRTFIETSSFAKRVDREGRGVWGDIQSELLKNPESGPVIQGTGGLRKLRMRGAGRANGAATE